jgi:predicted CDP-diglyceride synthetase/phosphatidate cytidylyltransferase
MSRRFTRAGAVAITAAVAGVLVALIAPFNPPAAAVVGVLVVIVGNQLS